MTRKGLTSIVQTCYHDSTSTTRGEEKARFDDGKDGKAASALEDRARDDLISGDQLRADCAARAIQTPSRPLLALSTKLLTGRMLWMKRMDVRHPRTDVCCLCTLFRKGLGKRID